MSFNSLPFDHEDLLNGLPSFNNTMLLIETIKNIPSHSVTCLDRKQLQQKPNEQDSIIQQIRKHNPIEPIPMQSPETKKKKGGCTCRKTNCLKRYCECFSSGKSCTEECACCECMNTVQHEELVKKTKESMKNKSSRKVTGGCICRKSQCQKKYCECFNAGVACTDACKCIDCENHNPHQHEHEHDSSENDKNKIKSEKGENSLFSKIKSGSSLSYIESISEINV